MPPELCDKAAVCSIADKARPRHVTRIPTGLLLVLALAAAPAAWADAEPRTAQLYGNRVQLATEPVCAGASEVGLLVDALQARLPNLTIELPVRTDPTTPLIRWMSSPNGGCELSLRRQERIEALPLGPGAGEEDIRAAAIRLAFWLEASGDPPPPAEPPVAEPPPPPDEDDEEPSLPPLIRRVAIDAQFGAGFYPTPSRAAGIVRVLLLIPVSTTVQVGIEGRLGTEFSIPNPVTDLDMQDRSIGLLGRYQDRIGGPWSVDVSLGFRWALAKVEADGGFDVSIDETISNLMLITGVGVGLDLTTVLRLKADILGSIAVATRQVRFPSGEVGDVGVLSLDALLGFELSF